MSKVWKKVIEEAKGYSLSEEERSLLLSKVKNHINQEYVPSIKNIQNIETPYFYKFKFAFTWHEKRFVPVAVLLIMALFGGTAFAANYALPGDALFSMKVNFNEEVESWLALSPDESVNFQTMIVERRLKELEKVTIQKKKISVKAKAQVKKSIEKNIQKVKEKTAEIAANGDSTKASLVKVELENKLEAHSVVLSKLATDSEEEKITEINEEDKAGIIEINELVDAHLNDLKLTEDTPLAEEDTTLEDILNADDSKPETPKAELLTEDKEKVENKEEPALSISEEKKDLKTEDSKKEDSDKKSEEGELKKSDKKESDNPEVEEEIKNILKELELPL